MKIRIFFSICLISVFVLIISSFVSITVIYNDFYRRMKEDIQLESEYIRTAIEVSGGSDIGVLERQSFSNSRITLVAADGAVVFDNKVDIGELGNHSDRPEIIRAFESGTGEAARFSDTLDEKNYYYAVLLKDGNVLRVSGTTASVYSSIGSILPWMSFSAVAVLTLALFAAGVQTKHIVKPINEIDLDHPENTELYDELSPLLSRIEKQNGAIGEYIKKLKEKQTEFTAISDNMNEGLLILDEKAVILSCNKSARKMLGIDNQSYLNASILKLNRSRDFLEIIETARKGLPSEKKLTLRDRTYLYIASPVMPENEIKGIVILILDVTEETEREQLRREFSANVSHELKTPLTSISGYAELIYNGIAKQEDVKSFSGKIYHEAQRLIILIEDIITLSRLDEKSSEFIREPVDLLESAKYICSRLDSCARQKNVGVYVSGESILISGVRHIIDQMLYNLCDNAIKYNKPDGRVDVAVKKDGGKAIVTVADTGIGIAGKDIDRVFERFYRVDKSHSKETGGTGLGLSIVKHAAMYHDAKITLDSRLDVGTTVSVIFDMPENTGV